MLQARQNKPVQRLADPVGMLYWRQGLRLRRNKSPMIGPFCSFFDPLAQKLNLLGRKRRRMVRHAGFRVF